MSNEQTAEVATDAVPTPRLPKATTRDPILVALLRSCDLIDGLDDASQVFVVEYLYNKYASTK